MCNRNSVTLSLKTGVVELVELVTCVDLWFKSEYHWKENKLETAQKSDLMREILRMNFHQPINSMDLSNAGAPIRKVK